MCKLLAIVYLVYVFLNMLIYYNYVLDTCFMQESWFFTVVEWNGRFKKTKMALGEDDVYVQHRMVIG